MRKQSNPRNDGGGNSGLSDGFGVSENARIFKEIRDDAK